MRKAEGAKRKAQLGHARRRASERYGVQLHHALAQELVKEIQAGKAPFVGRQSNRITVFMVTLPDGEQARAVYDKQRKVIVTLLPREGREMDLFAEQ